MRQSYGRASYTILKGVSVARRKRLNPAAVTTSRMRLACLGTEAHADAILEAFAAETGCDRMGRGAE
jgi:hypothetical protein